MPVVDASVAVDWIAPDADPARPAGRLLARLDEGGHRIIAPRLLGEEVANALVTGIRRGRWSGAAADDAYDAFRRLPVEFVDTSDDLDRAWELSRRYDAHPFYDMVYVATAERIHEQLVTSDQRLRRRVTTLSFVVSPEEFAS